MAASKSRATYAASPLFTASQKGPRGPFLAGLAGALGAFAAGVAAGAGAGGAAGSCPKAAPDQARTRAVTQPMGNRVIGRTLPRGASLRKIGRSRTKPAEIASTALWMAWGD